jgi:hypothetical protein
MIKLGAQLESFRSLKDKTFKVTFETHELTPEELTGITENLNQYGYLAFKAEKFNKKELDMLENLETDFIENTGKTNSERLRNVLYKNFEKNQQGFRSFATYYEHHMELIINHYKSKL